MADRAPPGAVKGRVLVVVFLAALVLVLGFVFFIGATGGGTANTPHPAGSAGD